VAAPICYGCLHQHPGLTCDAFPGRIPNAILLSQLDLRKPVAGDTGIMFKPKTHKDAGYAESLLAPWPPPERNARPARASRAPGWKLPRRTREGNSHAGPS
jgi:hypothetical protein